MNTKELLTLILDVQSNKFNICKYYISSEIVFIWNILNNGK